MSERRMVGEIPVPLGRAEFAVQLRDPGIVRHVTYQTSERLIMVGGKPTFDEHLVLFVESDPNGAFRDRKFAVLRPGQTIGVGGPLEPEYVGTAFDSTGKPAHVYEVRKASS